MIAELSFLKIIQEIVNYSNLRDDFYYMSVRIDLHFTPLGIELEYQNPIRAIRLQHLGSIPEGMKCESTLSAI